MFGEHVAIQVGDVPKCDLAVRAVQRGHHRVHEALVEMQHPLCVEQVTAMRAGQTPPIRCCPAGGERFFFSAATGHERIVWSLPAAAGTIAGQGTAIITSV
jgi:hypothetical protein